MNDESNVVTLPVIRIERFENTMAKRTVEAGRENMNFHIKFRADGIKEWLDETAPYVFADQKHLEEHTPERAYWHMGYRAALLDVLNQQSGAKS